MKKAKKNSKYKVLFIKALIPLTLIVLLKTMFFKAPEQKVDIYVEKSMTSGIFNEYKIKDIAHLETIFSDGHYAVVNIKGRDIKSNEMVSYDVYAVKGKNQWKIEKITQKDVLSNSVKNN